MSNHSNTTSAPARVSLYGATAEIAPGLLATGCGWAYFGPRAERRATFQIWREGEGGERYLVGRVEIPTKAHSVRANKILDRASELGLV